MIKKLFCTIITCGILSLYAMGKKPMGTSILAITQQPKEIQKIISEYVDRDYLGGEYEELTPLEIPGKVATLLYSPDSKKLAIASNEKSYQTNFAPFVLNLSTYTKDWTYPWPQEVTSFAFSTNGSLLALGAQDSNLMIISNLQGKTAARRNPMSPCFLPIAGLSFSPDNKEIVVAVHPSRNIGLLRATVYDDAGGKWTHHPKIMHLFTDAQTFFTHFSVSSTKQIYAAHGETCTGSSVISFFKYSQKGLAKLFEMHTPIITGTEIAGDFSPSNNYYAFSDGNNLYVVDIKAQQFISRLPLDDITQLLFLNEDTISFRKRDDSDLHMVNNITSLMGESHMFSLPMDETITTFAVAPDQSELAVALTNGKIRRFRKKLLHELQEIES